MCKDSYVFPQSTLPKSQSPLSPVYPRFFLAQSGSLNQLQFICQMDEKSNTVLIDSGASTTFITKSLVTSFGKHIMPLAEPLPLFAFDSAMEPWCFLTEKATWFFELPNFPKFEWSYFIIEADDLENAILGYDFLKDWNPIIDWQEGLITPQTGKATDFWRFSSVEQVLNKPTQHPALSRRQSLPSDCKHSILSLHPTGLFNPFQLPWIFFCRVLQLARNSNHLRLTYLMKRRRTLNPFFR